MTGVNPLDSVDNSLDPVTRRRLGNMDREIANLIRRRDSLAGRTSGLAKPDPDRGKTRKMKSRPKIVENIQIVPPRAGGESARSDRGPDSQSESWTVVKRGRKPSVPPRIPMGQSGIAKKNPGDTGNRGRRRKPPKTAAVVIAARKAEFSYADALKKARESISLTDLGISKPKIRVTRSGDRLIEIPGSDGARLADELAVELRKVFKDEAFVSRPFMKGELRLFGLDDSVTSFEVAEVIADLGGCKPDEVKVGQIRLMSNGLRTVWMQCPLAAAIAVTSQPRVRIGWSTLDPS